MLRNSVTQLYCTVFKELILRNEQLCTRDVGIWNGWLAFVVSIFIIGVQTALVGDLASHFGCSVGVKDTITAISFIALGTSVPGSYFFIIQ